MILGHGQEKGRMKRILVVDDDDNLREILSAMLSQRGRTVDTARNGIEALELVNQNQYDVILSDLCMPGLDGPALYEALRATPQTTIPRVIFMTGNAGSGKYATFLRGTTEPMLEKPFNLDTVRHVVNVLLGEQ
jgi:two-component system, chemotaxis family, chemotaxis protein CheY